MKAQKKLNIVLIVLVIVLISIISFVGIYHLDKNQMVNMLPNYILGTNLSGYRKVSLEPESIEAETNSETVTLGDPEENASEDSNESNNESAEANANDTASSEQQETQPTVLEEDMNNYKTSAEIIKSRLKCLKVDDFSISLEGDTGKINLALPENSQTDIILSDITQVGKFEISDTNTGDVLMTNDDIKDVSVEKIDSYGSSIIQMNIKFNIAGSRKFKNITRDYNENAVIETENTVEGETSNEVTEDVANNEATEDVASNETSEGESTETEDTTNTTAKTVTLKIDDKEMLSTGFSEIVDNGVLALTLGSSTDEEELKQSLYSGYNVAAILENDYLPLNYEVTENVYVASTIDTNELIAIIGVLIGIALIVSIFLIAKFKMKGLLATFLSIGYVAVLLIVIRYTNVIMSLEGILAVGLAFIINSVFNYLLFSKLKNKELSKEERIAKYNATIKQYALILIPVLILSVVCCFTNWDTIYSFGMILFWGIIISLLYNLIVTNLLVRNK